MFYKDRCHGRGPMSSTCRIFRAVEDLTIRIVIICLVGYHHDCSEVVCGMYPLRQNSIGVSIHIQVYAEAKLCLSK